MNDPEKLELVCSLTESIKNQFAAALRAGEVPETWTGMEIRQWLADRFQSGTFPMSRKRAREYANTVGTSANL